MIDRGDSQCGAVFSDCERYRYRLWRRWSDEPVMAFVMLNPSTADEAKNDPTIERCERRARSGGYGGIEIANLFALRSTDPRGLLEVDDPVGPDNDPSILSTIRTAQEHGGMAVMAWGGWSRVKRRQEAVIDMLERNGVLWAHAFKLNADGTPAHPLYLPYSLQPRQWWFANGKLDAAI